MEMPDITPENGDSPATVNYIPYELKSKITAEDNTYVLDIALERPSYSTFAASLSSRTIKVFSVEQEVSTQNLCGHSRTITNLSYSNKNSNLLYSSSLDGTIRLWDLRAKGQVVQKFIDDTDGPRKAIASFDLNCDENYICGGTELIHEDAFLIFWDQRTSKLLGGYWNSHTGDITEVACHPHKNNVLASGSIDGLINVFDLNQNCEDEALTQTLNTGSSVSKLNWNARRIDNLDDDQLACLTHMEDIQMWNISDAQPFASFNRDTLKVRSEATVDYLIDTLKDEDAVYLSSGDKNGDVQICRIDDTNPFLWSQLLDGHSDVVRAVAWNPQDRVIFTGGEDGVVCIWCQSAVSRSKNKVMSQMKKLSINCQ